MEALGKIGESAAERPFHIWCTHSEDQDNRVIALAVEALGQMGESADEAIPALGESLSHLNPQVRRNAAKALGSLGEAASSAAHGRSKSPRETKTAESAARLSSPSARLAPQRLP